MGKHTSRWGGEDAQPTCKANPRAKPTRIDGVVANKAAVAWIAGYNVIKDPMTPTHSVVQLKLKRKAAREERAYAKSLPSLKRFYTKKVRELVGDKKEKRRRLYGKDKRRNYTATSTTSWTRRRASSSYTAKPKTQRKCGRYGPKGWKKAG